jgi:hypothetical protein
MVLTIPPARIAPSPQQSARPPACTGVAKVLGEGLMSGNAKPPSQAGQCHTLLDINDPAFWRAVRYAVKQLGYSHARFVAIQFRVLRPPRSVPLETGGTRNA